MKTIKILLCLCMFVYSCTASQSSKTIFSIKVNSEKIESLTISKYDFELEKMIEFKSFTELLENKVYKVIDSFYEPTIYIVKFNTGEEIRIAVEKRGLINLQLGDKVFLESKVATISDFNQKIEKLNKQFFTGMMKDYDVAMKKNDQISIAKLEKKKDKVLVEFISAMEDTVRKMGPSALAFDALPYFDLYKNYDFLKEMTNAFEVKYPDSGMSKSIRARIDKADEVAIGRRAPYFNALNMESSVVELTNFKGSYVLIDFWASWCRPCRIENPKLVDLYEAFKDINFNIIGVSIDSDASLWKKAIEKDKLPWTQIRDVNHSIYNSYLLSSLPSNFLLDKEGKIVAKNINASQLKIQLEIFRSK